MSASPVLDALGLPRVASGMFASVYCLQKENHRWAVRCFLTNSQTTRERYANISCALSEAKLDSILEFDLQDEGIRIHGSWYPILKMEWCDGISLNTWLSMNLRKKNALEEFLKNWKQLMSSLKNAGIAHGDLQHGNILIDEGKIKLVDYDGMFVPALKGEKSVEVGHRNYQHPGRDHTIFGANLDNFSAWLIYLSVQISMLDPSLWQRFSGGDECILFRAADLQNPLQSQLFYALQSHPNGTIKKNSWILRYLLSLPVEEIPALDSEIVIEMKRNAINKHLTPFGLLEASNPNITDPLATTDVHTPKPGAQRAKGSKASGAIPQRKLLNIVLASCGVLWLLSVSIGRPATWIPTFNYLDRKPAKETQTIEQVPMPFAVQKSLDASLDGAYMLETAETDDVEAKKIYSYVLEQTENYWPDKEEAKLAVKATQGINRLDWKKRLKDPMAFVAKDTGPYSIKLRSCYDRLKEKKYTEAAASYSKLINEMLSVKQIPTSGIAAHLVELSLAYQQLGQCREAENDYQSALSAYLNAVHIDRDVFGPTGTDVIMDNYLHVCKNAELAGKLDFAEKTYSRLVELTERDENHAQIYSDAKSGLKRVQELIAKQSSK